MVETLVTSTAAERTRSSLSWVLGILVGILLTVAITGAMVWFATGVGVFHLVAALRGGHTQINVDQPTVVRQIQQLRRLETVSYAVDKIISGEHDNPYIPKFLVSDRLLLMVHGEVIGGVDLAKLRASDVTTQGRSITIHLPAAEVFTIRLDNAQTRVYSRDTGLFSSPDPNLETEVRQEAERQLEAAARQDGILKLADQNARTTISSMLTALGFTSIQTP
jgi:flagellar basal body-associated protein FliL